MQSILDNDSEYHLLFHLFSDTKNKNYNQVTGQKNDLKPWTEPIPGNKRLRHSKGSLTSVGGIPAIYQGL